MYTIYEVNNGVSKPWANCDILTSAIQICNNISEKYHCRMIVVNQKASLYDVGSQYDPNKKLVLISPAEITGANMYTIYEVKNGICKPWADCDILTYAMQICNAISQLNHCHMIAVNECDTLVMYDVGSQYDPDERLVII